MGAIQDQLESDYEDKYWKERHTKDQKNWNQFLLELNQVKSHSQHRYIEAKLAEMRDYAQARLWESRSCA